MTSTARLYAFLAKRSAATGLKLLIALVLIITLSACAHFTAFSDKTLPTTRQQHIAQLAKLQHWTITGSIGIRTKQDTQSAFINWQQQGINQYVMQIFGPFGAGGATLTGMPRLVTLTTTSPPKTYRATTAEQLLRQQLGWTLPVSNLFYWVRGLPAPDAPAKQQWDNAHQLTQLEQQGWQIAYLRYTSVNNYILPNKMLLTNPKIQVRIVVNAWHLR